MIRKGAGFPGHDPMNRLSKNGTVLRTPVPAGKEELRRRIEANLQWKTDLDFLTEKTGLQAHQLITGLWLDCNLMRADKQTLLAHEKKEFWPISEDTLRRTIKNIRGVASQIRRINQSEDLSPTLAEDVGVSPVVLPEALKWYAGELERRVEIQAAHWKGKRARIPELVDLTRANSLYARIRSAGGYHQTRLLRLVNVARRTRGYSRVSERAFTLWLNRLEKRKTKLSE